MSVQVTEHQRPGVYSVYEASAVVSGRTGGKAAGVVGVCAGATPGEVVTVYRTEQATEKLGKSEKLTGLVELLLENGAARVCVVPISNSEGYEEGFAALEKADVAVVVCDSTEKSVEQTMRESVKRASDKRKERIAVAAGGEKESAEELIARAGEINCERVALVPGGVKAAAAVAGAIAGESDPAVPLGGAELTGLEPVEEDWSEKELDSLILGGVTPLENGGGVVEVVRGVTTRTKTGGAEDGSWRELTTIRVVDDVIPGLRKALATKFSRAKNTEQGRGAIRSQVIVELEQKVAEEIITGYDGVTVTALEDDPSVCLVEFRFGVAHGLNQIWLSANVEV